MLNGVSSKSNAVVGVRCGHVCAFAGQDLNEKEKHQKKSERQQQTEVVRWCFVGCKEGRNKEPTAVLLTRREPHGTEVE